MYCSTAYEEILYAVGNVDVYDEITVARNRNGLLLEESLAQVREKKNFLDRFYRVILLLFSN